MSKIDEAKIDLLRAREAKKNFHKRWSQSGYANISLYEQYVRKLDDEKRLTKFLKKHGAYPE